MFFYWLAFGLPLYFFVIPLYSIPVSPPVSTPATAPSPAISSFQLSNGMRVILAPIDHMKATCVLFYHLTGTRDDPAAVKGGSYLYQTLMLRETQNLANFERLVYIKRSGGISNRRVGYDYSIFYQVVPASEINNALWLESERISSLKLSDRHIQTERNNIYRRYNRLNTSNIRVWSMNWIRSKVFQGTIYETPVYGKLDQLQKFNTSAIRGLYRNFTDLSRIVMVVSGKFEPAEIRRSVSKHFAGLSSKPRPPRKPMKTVPPREKYEYFNREVENLEDHFVLIGIRAPGKLSHDYLFFDFLRYYLADNRVSKLEQVLNHDNQLDIAIEHVFTDHLESNALIIRLESKKRVNLERAKYFVNKLFTALRKGKPGTLSSGEFRNTRELIEIDFLKNIVSPEARARFLAERYTATGGLNSEKRYHNRIRTINSFDVYRIGKKYFDKNNRVSLNVYGK